MVVQEFNKYFIQNQKSAYEMIKEIVDEQGIKLKEENMEDRNKTVAELIADLQNQLNKANNRIDELVVVNKSLNKALIKDMYKNILNARYGTTGLGLYYESTDDGYTKYLEGLLLKEKAKNTDLQNELDKANNHIEELTHKNTKLISENDDLSKEIAKWHNKYTKEKAKHDKATKMIDELL